MQFVFFRGEPEEKLFFVVQLQDQRRKNEHECSR